MGKQPRKVEITACLKSENIGMLATLDHHFNVVRLRVMYYGLDDHFNLYFMSTKDSPKMDQIKSHSDISFLIFGLGDPYDKSWEVEVNGEAEILEKKEDVDFALSKLQGKNPFADVAIESGITAQFSFVRIKPWILRFRVYGEALKGEPPTVLEF